ncbi:MAG: 2,3,4,5-tetrahydropyridine-2,6-dicarboxylate N-succinyltransferase [Gammaproteobacteria bacterium]|nr:2,3,4,5-tetrahydropyridine-2,6-dicarboxylate N-succinyltransferase [Gammaproteobacteria bacterium]
MANSQLFSLAFGIGTQNSKGEWLEVWFPAPRFGPARADVQALLDVLGHTEGNADYALDDATCEALAAVADGDEAAALRAFGSSDKPAVATVLETDDELGSTPQTYLKLHLLSHRFVLPNEMNLDGIFPLLPNVAWTNAGAIDLEELPARQLEARVAGTPLHVHCVDKFPRMADYVVPSGMRIADASRARLGAYIGEGTTVMHEGQINFNSGCIGPNMIEGRISQGVTVGKGSDLGGSASTAGTLSGGGSIVISVGEECLVSANAGTGIPLGDRCTIEAGLYITPGTVVQVLDEERNFVKQVKARELAGQHDMLFIRNSQTGIVECRTNKRAIALNETLHANN